MHGSRTRCGGVGSLMCARARPDIAPIAAASDGSRAGQSFDEAEIDGADEVGP
jgi:hypothetical protein